jgi:hypothetical protein
MNKNIKSTIDTIGSVVGVITDNLQTYTTNALNNIKNMKQETESETKPVLGYQTGDQGWYDQVGGGPCDKYCRYTGLSPNVQWTCSDESDLTKLRVIPKSQTGRYCYDYDRKTNPSPKSGVVFKGSYFPTTAPQAQSAGDYNFLIYNNKDANGIENFNMEYGNYENIENFESQGTWTNPRVGEDHPGNDIALVSSISSADCQTKCAANSQCAGIVVDDSGTNCWMKSTMGPAVPALNRNAYFYTKNQTPQSGYASGPNIGKPQTGTDYPGNDIINQSVSNAQECATDCQNQAGCKAFVTNAAGNYCWLKGSLGSPTSNSDRITYAYGADKNAGATDPRWNGPQKLDYPGNDINSFSINQVSDCGTQCYNNPNCAGFVTTDAGDFCWLKSSLGASNQSPNRNTYTIDRNPKSTDPRWTGPESIYYENKFIQQMPITQVSQCGEACAKNGSCVGFATNDAATQCALYSNFSNPINYPGIHVNTYKMKAHYDTLDNLTLNDCENVCQNDDTCKGFSYDSAKKTCVISQEKLDPVGFNTENIVGNKKQHMALNGMYNIYQNNACVNSSLFGPSPTVEGSLGIKVDSNGTPKIPKGPVCAQAMNNDFIFGKNYEIMTIKQDVGSSESQNTGITDKGLYDDIITNTTDKSWDLTDAYCLQKNSDNSVSTNTCTYTDNQKWTWDDKLKNIRSWDGNCLNVDTTNNNVLVSVKPCVNDINQRFDLKATAKNLQPKYNVISTTNSLGDVINNGGIGTIKTVNTMTDVLSGRLLGDRVIDVGNSTSSSDQTENFAATNTNINNYLSANRNSKDYLYKLPYGSSYVQNINDDREDYQSMQEEEESISRSLYLIYLIVLVLVTVLLMRK